jgi:FAD/FMN-containing dehydrogenase
LDIAALSAFGERFHGEVVLPGSADYDDARAVWNGMIDRRPALVTRCADVDDVVLAVRFGREQELPIAVRSGGHSVGGFSTCDDGVVIDLSRIRGVDVDPERRVARVSGGTLLRELDEAAQAVGLACPVGVVGHTGVAGLTLGGGMGRLQRHFGFTIDNLLAVDLVTAAGDRLRVSDEEHGDLFWGMRGAGPNFGVVTAFEFRLHELDPIVTQGFVSFPGHRAHEVAAFLRAFTPTAPEELMVGVEFALAPPDPPFAPGLAGPIVSVAATHSGAPERADDVVRPLRDLGPLVDTIRRRRYLDVQAQSDESMAWGKRFYMKGGFLAELTDAFVDEALDQVTSAPSLGSTITLWLQGGAIADVPPDATAFTGREAPFWLAVESEWDEPRRDEEHVAWGRATMTALRPFTAAGHYANDMIEVDDDVVRSAYGDAKVMRLRSLKREHDPDNVFRMNLNIAP